MPRTKRHKPKITLYGGIDPGGTGALFLIRKPIVPLFWGMTPCNETQRVNLIEQMLNIYPRRKYNFFFVLESVHAMPRQGVSSCFTFGTDFGMWRGILASYKIPFQLVTPKTWRKGLIKKTDFETRVNSEKFNAAARLFPEKADVYFKGPQGGIKAGVCDAALMAVHGSRL